MQKKIPSLLAVLLMLGLSACASAPSDPAQRAEFKKLNDPLEPMNRTIFDFNMFVDRNIFVPLAKTYRTVTPDFVQGIVSNVLYNAGEPVRMANALLQGRVTDAHTIFQRFFVNTALGGAGLADVASAGGLTRVDADFGQTLHVWGAPEGPYMVLPIFGPSNPRDAVGLAGDMMAQPWGHLAGLRGPGTENRYTIASTGATLLSRRVDNLDAMESLEKGSLDFYAQLRSVSRQYRHKQLGIAANIDRSEYGDDESVAPGKDATKPLKKKKRTKKKAATPVVMPVPAEKKSEAAPAPAAPQVQSSGPQPSASVLPSPAQIAATPAPEPAAPLLAAEPIKPSGQ